jgi:hypothetical protein
MQVQIAGSAGPVRIDSCAAGYGKDTASAGIPFVNVSQTDTNLIGASYGFTNVSQRPISTIRFAFRELDAFGEGPAYGVFVYDWNGMVQPGASYTANAAQGYNLTGGDVATIVCSVQKVRFADGSVWDGGPSTQPGLYYPPTPSPPAAHQSSPSH